VKAFVVARYGSEAGAEMRELPEPDVGKHDVLVEVRAASVNPLDARIRDGEFSRALVDAGAIRPVVDRIFPFESTQEAMAYVGTGRAKGKVVVTMG
jgi:NADPH:quinone reductase-like Zn-dependent oxidoreductase